MPPARLLFYLATGAGLAFAGHSLVYGPPPAWIALGLLFVYLNICVWGVVLSRFSMFADVVTLGPRAARGVALTFDDGPDPESTPKVLDLLDDVGAEATFFVIGHKAEAHPDLLREISERGHAVGVHSYCHSRLFSFFPPWRIKEDLQKSVDLIQRITGVRPTLYRAPIGHVSPSMGKVVKELGLMVIGWSVRGVDGWSGAKPNIVAGKVNSKLKDGAIVMLHDASERGDFTPASIAALPKIFDAADKKQLSFVRVDRWLAPADDELAQEAYDAS